MSLITLNPDSSTGGTTVDGRAYDTDGGSWLACRSGGGTLGSSAVASTGSIHSGKDSGDFTISRGIFTFNTAVIGSANQVTSATLSVYVNSKTNGDNDGDDWFNVVAATPAANNNIVNADFTQVGGDTPTEYGTRQDITGISTGQYLDIPLNAAGIAHINLAGITRFGLREGHDVLDSAYAGADNTTNSITINFADAGSNPPKLTITYVPVTLSTIAFDAATSGTVTTASSLTYSHTVGSGADRLLVVGVWTGSNTSGDTLTSVTYNGVAMTRIHYYDCSTADPETTNDRNTYLYYLVNPASGAHNVVVSCNTGANPIGSEAASYTGVHQTLQPDNYAHLAYASGQNFDISLTPNVDKCWIIGYTKTNNISSYTGATERVKEASSRSSIYDTNAAVTPPASTTLRVTTGSSASNVQIIASFRPAFVVSAGGAKVMIF